MIDIVYSPRWFYGKDILIDIVSIIVLSLLTFATIKFYRMSKKKNYLWLALSFFLLGVSFISKIIMNFTIYYQFIETRNIGFVKFTYHTLRSSDNLFLFGFLIYRFLTLFGYYILFSIYKKQSKSTIIFISYLLLLTIISTQSAYYIFHLTSLLLLFFITHQFCVQYKKTKNPNTKYLRYSFGIITLSQLFFMFIKINPVLYAVGEIVQLTGYSVLLATFIMVLIHGKKKIKT